MEMQVKGGCMKTYSIHLRQPEEVKTKIPHLSLPELLPSGRILALNLESRTLSLLSEGPVLMIEQQFSVNEMSMLVPLLESFPHYCPYEVLLAHTSSNLVTATTIEHCRQRLQEALSRGTWQQELRSMYRALSSLRTKLHRFELEISNVRERGWSLTNLRSIPSSDHVPLEIP